MIYPTYPGHRTHPTYPAYQPPPAYPPTGGYNPWRSYEQAAANAEASPQPTPPRGFWTGHYSFVFAVVAVCVTVAALVLAIAGPSLAQNITAPSSDGLTRVFDGALSNNGQWENTDSCYFSSSGLDVSSTLDYAQCRYKPSVNSDLTSQGFSLQVTLAPAATVTSEQVAVISAAGASVEISQQGSFTVCDTSELPCPLDTRTTSTGATVAWHTDSYVANTIAIQFSPGDSRIAFLANGQQFASVPAGETSGAISLGTAPGGEALYTHATLYSASSS